MSLLSAVAPELEAGDMLDSQGRTLGAAGRDQRNLAQFARPDLLALSGKSAGLPICLGDAIWQSRMLAACMPLPAAQTRHEPTWRCISDQCSRHAGRVSPCSSRVKCQDRHGPSNSNFARDSPCRSYRPIALNTASSFCVAVVAEHGLCMSWVDTDGPSDAADLQSFL